MREGAVMYFLWFVLWYFFFFPKKFCFRGLYLWMEVLKPYQTARICTLYLGSQRSGPLGGDLSL